MEKFKGIENYIKEVCENYGCKLIRVNITNKGNGFGFISELYGISVVAKIDSHSDFTRLGKVLGLRYSNYYPYAKEGEFWGDFVTYDEDNYKGIINVNHIPSDFERAYEYHIKKVCEANGVGIKYITKYSNSSDSLLGQALCYDIDVCVSDSATISRIQRALSADIYDIGYEEYGVTTFSKRFLFFPKDDVIGNIDMVFDECHHKDGYKKYLDDMGELLEMIEGIYGRKFDGVDYRHKFSHTLPNSRISFYVGE